MGGVGLTIETKTSSPRTSPSFLRAARLPQVGILSIRECG